MNKKEKIHILNTCIQYFQKAIMTKDIDTATFLVYAGAGQAFKGLIEDLIDCQSNPYYNQYQYIVKLYNKLDI